MGLDPGFQREGCLRSGPIQKVGGGGGGGGGRFRSDVRKVGGGGGRFRSVGCVPRECNNQLSHHLECHPGCVIKRLVLKPKIIYDLC